jgi:uncharacterized membrane protein
VSPNAVHLPSPYGQSLGSRLMIPVLGAVGFVGGAAALAMTGPHRSIHGPNLALFAHTSLALKIHVAAAVFAFGLGMAMFASRKGARFHRIAGWSWVVLMGLVAGSSLLITGLNGHSYSYIHLLSGFTLIMLPLAVVAARKHDVVAHRRRMTGLFLGSMVIAGAFTFLPGRLMWQVFFG